MIYIYDFFVRSLKPAGKLIDDSAVERPDNVRSRGIKARRRRNRRGDSQSPQASFEAKPAKGKWSKAKVRIDRRRRKASKGQKSWVGVDRWSLF